MFTCIACTKQLGEEREVEGGARESGTPSTKEAVKSLTAQVLNLTFSLLIYFFPSATIFAFATSFFHRSENKQNHNPI